MARSRTLPSANARRRSTLASFSEGSPRSCWRLRRAKTHVPYQNSGAGAQPYVGTGVAYRNSHNWLVAFAQSTYHKANARVSRHGGCLEYALYDKRRYPTINLKHGDTWKIFPGVDLFPQLTFVLQHAE